MEQSTLAHGSWDYDATDPVRLDQRKRIAVIIVNWNGWRDTIECLDTLLAQDYRNYLIVIVDNDSRDGSVEKIAEWCDKPYRPPGSSDIEGVMRLSDCVSMAPVPYQIGEAGVLSKELGSCRLFIVRSGGNLGFAGGCNAGAEYVVNCGCDYIWLLNSDTVVHRSSLTELVRKASKLSSQGLFGSTLLYYRRPTIIQALGGADLNVADCVIRHRGEGVEHTSDSVSRAARQELTYIVGASMLVPVSLIETIGLMQDDYFLYYEEIDWSYRARGRYRQIYAPQSLVYHKAGASSKDKVSEFSKRLLFSNKLLFFSRYLPHLGGRVWWQMAKEFVREVLMRRWLVAKILMQTMSTVGSRSKDTISTLS